MSYIEVSTSKYSLEYGIRLTLRKEIKMPT